MKPAIKIDQMSKKYVIRHEHREKYVSLRDVIANGAERLVQSIRHPFGAFDAKNQAHEEFWALDDISLDIMPGERIGIVGRNGAGKSTLLKVLSRITEPTKGRVQIVGRVASLLEVGTGFHPELTGRENIYLNGAILGMSKAEIRRNFDAIVDFAEVEKFLDTPVKRYSSGMYVRLAFSVAAHLESDILIVDEVLAVGDSAFQRKCMSRMESVAGEGRTILFVSHNMGAVAELCEKCMFLERGGLRSYGDVSDVIGEYLASGAGGGAQKVGFVLDEKLPSSIMGVSLVDEKLQKRDVFSLDEEIRIRVKYKVEHPIEDLITVITVSRNGSPVFHTYSSDKDERNQIHEPGIYRADCVVPRMFLKAGHYQVDINTTNPYVDYQRYENVIGFDIEEASINTSQKGYRANRAGNVVFQGKWEISRDGS